MYLITIFLLLFYVQWNILEKNPLNAMNVEKLVEVQPNFEGIFDWYTKAKNIPVIYVGKNTLIPKVSNTTFPKSMKQKLERKGSYDLTVILYLISKMRKAELFSKMCAIMKHDLSTYSLSL